MMRQHDSQYKEKSKKDYDKKRHVKKSQIKVGDKEC